MIFLFSAISLLVSALSGYLPLVSTTLESAQADSIVGVTALALSTILSVFLSALDWISRAQHRDFEVKQP